MHYPHYSTPRNFQSRTRLDEIKDIRFHAITKVGSRDEAAILTVISSWIISEARDVLGHGYAFRNYVFAYV